MFFFGFFTIFAHSKRLGEILEGEWSGGSIFSTNENFNFENSTFIVAKKDGLNHLQTTLFDRPLYFHLSTVDLTGTVEYEGNSYSYNLTQTSPPLVSSDIDLGDIMAHVSFASHKCLRIVLLNSEGDSTTIVLTKTEHFKFDIIKIIPFIVGSSLFYLMNKCFNNAASQAEEQLRQKEEKEKQASKEEDKEKSDDSKENTEIKTEKESEIEKRKPKQVNEE